MFTDTHCHIDDKNYNIEELIKNANKNKITKMINNGCDYESNEEVLKISENYPEIYSAIGFHPQNLESFKEEFLNVTTPFIPSLNPRFIYILATSKLPVKQCMTPFKFGKHFNMSITS